MIIEKIEFELLKSELVFRIWVSENCHNFKTLTNLNVSNCAHKWPKIEQKIFQVTVKCFSLLDDSSLQLIDSGRPLKLTLLEEILVVPDWKHDSEFHVPFFLQFFFLFIKPFAKSFRLFFTGKASRKLFYPALFALLNNARAGKCLSMS